MKKDLQRKRGDTYPIKWTVTEGGKTLPIAGYTFTLSVSTQKEPDTADYEFQLDGIITDAAAGKVVFYPTETDVDRVGDFYYDIEVVDDSGYTHTPKEGKIKFTQDITK